MHWLINRFVYFTTADLKVIEIKVEKVPNKEVLFECKEGVFVRRKGILTGPIRPSHIQEWIKVVGVYVARMLYMLFFMHIKRRPLR